MLFNTYIFIASAYAAKYNARNWRMILQYTLSPFFVPSHGLRYSILHLLLGSCQLTAEEGAYIMKSNLVSLARKHKWSIRLLTETVTYRVSLPVTKVVAYTNDTYPVCPRCAISLNREYMSFCDRCGQKLNWGLFDHAKVVHPNYKKE